MNADVTTDTRTAPACLCPQMEAYLAAEKAAAVTQEALEGAAEGSTAQGASQTSETSSRGAEGVALEEAQGEAPGSPVSSAHKCEQLQLDAVALTALTTEGVSWPGAATMDADAATAVLGTASQAIEGNAAPTPLLTQAPAAERGGSRSLCASPTLSPTPEFQGVSMPLPQQQQQQQQSLQLPEIQQGGRDSLSSPPHTTLTVAAEGICGREGLHGQS